MDQIAKALTVINSFRFEEFSGAVNPTSGARLNFDAQLHNLRLSASDGMDPGIAIGCQGFGVRNLSLPTPHDPSIALDPYARTLRVDLDERFFARAAVFLREPMVADLYGAINRVEMSQVETQVRLTPDKVAHVDVELDQLTLLHGQEELIRVLDLSLSVLDYDTKKPPALAQKDALVVLRKMRVEIEQRFFERILASARKKIPPMVSKLDVELPGPVMVVDATAKLKIPVSFRVDLRLDTENDMFGIFFDRFYVPGTNMRLPSFTRNLLLGLLKSQLEERLRGLVEISNESMRINPWSKVPLRLLKKVKTFEVEQRRIVLEFEPPDGDVPPGAHQRAQPASRVADAIARPELAPGPAVG